MSTNIERHRRDLLGQIVDVLHDLAASPELVPRQPGPGALSSLRSRNGMPTVGAAVSSLWPRRTLTSCRRSSAFTTCAIPQRHSKSPRAWGVKLVQRQLGHLTATMTLDRYGHLFPDDLDALSSALDGLRL
jgi:integrase